MAYNHDQMPQEQVPFRHYTDQGHHQGGDGVHKFFSASILRPQNFLRLDSEPNNAHNDDDDAAAAAAFDDDDGGGGGGGGEEEMDDGGGGDYESARHKAEILSHPLYEQLLNAHVSCLKIATPVDQLPRIDAQLTQSQRVVAKYSVLGNGGVVDGKELDQFMVIVLCLLGVLLLLVDFSQSVWLTDS